MVNTMMGFQLMRDADRIAQALNMVGVLGWWLLAAILTTEIWRGSEAFAVVANSLIAVEREITKAGIGVHWAFQVAKTYEDT